MSVAAAPILDSRYSWTRLGLSLLIATVGNAGMWTYVVLMPAVAADFGLARGAAALPYTTTMVGFALGNLVIGRLVDRVGIARALVVAAVLTAAGFAASAAAPHPVVLAAAMLLVGFGSAASFGPLIADVSLWFHRRRGIAVAIAASGNYLAGAIWPMLLAGLLAGQGWRVVCLALAAIVPAVMLPLAGALRRRVPAEAMAVSDRLSQGAARATALSPRQLQGLLGLAGIACCVAMAMPQVHIVALCVDLGYGPAVGAEMLSLMLAGGVVSRLLSGLVADRVGGVRTVLIGASLQGLALMLYLPFDGLVQLYLVSLVFGLAQGGIVPAYALIVREYLPAREAGARVGLVMMMTIIGMALGGWMSGAIYDLSGGYRLAFVNGIAWNALNLAVMLFILARSRGAAPGRGALAA
jgi:MFS family permease